jgi:hypothetical protein
MKNLNLKPLYIFLVIVGVAFIFKYTQPEKEIRSTSYRFEQSKDTPYKNSFEKKMHEQASDVKKGQKELRDEAAKEEMDVIFPGE